MPRRTWLRLRRRASIGPRILVADPKPCLLESVIGFAYRPQHPVRDSSQMRTMLLKPLCQPLALLHGK